MKRFRFPLRPVAVLRTHEELRAREAFGAAVHACGKAEENLNATRERVKQFEQTLQAGRSSAGAFSATQEAQALAAYRREWMGEGEAERALASARSTVQQRRIEYVDAHRRLEVVRKLETKAREEHRVETAREEQAEFDDFASRRFSGRSPFRT